MGPSGKVEVYKSTALQKLNFGDTAGFVEWLCRSHGNLKNGSEELQQQVNMSLIETALLLAWKNVGDDSDSASKELVGKSSMLLGDLLKLQKSRESVTPGFLEDCALMKTALDPVSLESADAWGQISAKVSDATYQGVLITFNTINTNGVMKQRVDATKSAGVSKDDHCSSIVAVLGRRIQAFSNNPFDATASITFDFSEALIVLIRKLDASEAQPFDSNLSSLATRFLAVSLVVRLLGVSFLGGRRAASVDPTRGLARARSCEKQKKTRFLATRNSC